MDSWQRESGDHFSRMRKASLWNCLKIEVKLSNLCSLPTSMKWQAIISLYIRFQDSLTPLLTLGKKKCKQLQSSREKDRLSPLCFLMWQSWIYPLGPSREKRFPSPPRRSPAPTKAGRGSSRVFPVLRVSGQGERSRDSALAHHNESPQDQGIT